MAGLEYSVLPNHALFNSIVRHAGRRPGAVAIRDDKANIERNHTELLSDVLAVREALRQNLEPAVLERLDDKDEEVYIALLAPGGYQFAVGILAIIAIGAAAVPLTVALPTAEAAYYIRKSRASLVIADSNFLRQGRDLETHIQSSGDGAFRCLDIGEYIGRRPLPLGQIFISSDRYLDESKPGLVIFTSGTTGPPKGAVMRRAYVSDHAGSIGHQYKINQNDAILHILPVHHATGLGVMFFPFLLAGACIEFHSGGFDEAWMWQRWREGIRHGSRRLTFFSGVPTIFMRMRRHYQRHLSRLPPADLADYIRGAKQFRAVLCGTSALPLPISQFWTGLLKKRILQRYGATEVSQVFMVRPGDVDIPEGSVGERVPGIQMKLSEGDEGEVLVKSPYSFSKYLHDTEATSEAHDDSGYFKTGDIARREGKYYFILGRTSIDILKSGGYKISCLDVEREILGLPYISEVSVVGVEDEEFGQRVAALIALAEESLADNDFRGSHSCPEHTLTIEALRRDLRTRLAGYKLPTLLRVVDGELPKTVTGKVIKKSLGPKMFPKDYKLYKEVQIWQKGDAASGPPSKL